MALGPGIVPGLENGGNGFVLLSGLYNDHGLANGMMGMVSVPLHGGR